MTECSGYLGGVTTPMPLCISNHHGRKVFPMRDRTHELDETVQTAMLNALLEAGVTDPTITYVVCPVDELVFQFTAALEDTKRKNTKTNTYVYRPPIAATQLMLTLAALGWTRKP